MIDWRNQPKELEKGKRDSGRQEYLIDDCTTFHFYNYGVAFGRRYGETEYSLSKDDLKKLLPYLIEFVDEPDITVSPGQGTGVKIPDVTTTPLLKLETLDNGEPGNLTFYDEKGSEIMVLKTNGETIAHGELVKFDLVLNYIIRMMIKALFKGNR